MRKTIGVRAPCCCASSEYKIGLFLPNDNALKFKTDRPIDFHTSPVYLKSLILLWGEGDQLQNPLHKACNLRSYIIDYLFLLIRFHQRAVCSPKGWFTLLMLSFLPSRGQGSAKPTKLHLLLNRSMTASEAGETGVHAYLSVIDEQLRSLSWKLTMSHFFMTCYLSMRIHTLNSCSVIMIQKALLSD